MLVFYSVFSQNQLYINYEYIFYDFYIIMVLFWFIKLINNQIH